MVKYVELPQLPGTQGPDVFFRGIDLKKWTPMSETYGGNDILNIYANPWGQDDVNEIFGLNEDGTPKANYQKFQRHVYSGAGDDQLNMIFAPYTGDEELRIGHHIYGDTGSDVFNFQDIDNIKAGQTVVGRIDDFDASRDSIQIDGKDIDLHDLPDNVRIVSYNGNYFDDTARWQQWILIENDHGGHIFYALEGARSDFYEWGNDETHFIRELPDFSQLKDVTFEDVHAAVPYEEYEDLDPANVAEFFNRDRAGEMAVNTGYGKLFTVGNDDPNIVDVINGGAGYDYLYAGAGDDLIAGGNSTDYIYGSDGDDKIWGGTEDDEAYGGGGADWVEGNYGEDLISGGAGSDVLYGNEDNDVIFGDNVVDDNGKTLSVFKFEAFHNDTFKGIETGTTSFEVTGGGAWISRPMTVLDDDNVLQDNNNNAPTGQTLDSTYQLLHGDYRGILEDSYVYSRGYYEITNNTTGETGKLYQIRVDANYSGSGMPGTTAQYYAPTDNLTFSPGDDLEITSGLNALGDVDYDELGDIITGPEYAAGYDTIFGGDGNDKIIGGNGDDNIHGDSGHDIIYGDNVDASLDSIDSNSSEGTAWSLNLYWQGVSDFQFNVGESFSPSEDFVKGSYQIIDDDGNLNLYDPSTTPALDMTMQISPYFPGIVGPTIDPMLYENAYVFTQGSYYVHDYDTPVGVLGGPVYVIGVDLDYNVGDIPEADFTVYGFGDWIADNPDEEYIITQDFELGEAPTYQQIGGTASPRPVIPSGQDVISGGEGNDTIYGGIGNDQIHGDNGHDKLYGGLDEDELYGDDGHDTLVGGLGPDKLYGGKGNDTFYGGTTAEPASTTAQSSFLGPIDGHNSLYGGEGNDRFELNYDNSNVDTIYGGSGRDTLSYTSAQYAGSPNARFLEINLRDQTDSFDNHIYDVENVVGSQLDDQIIGSDDANRIEAGAGNDRIFGIAGNDSIFGQDGRDAIYGGDGTDRLYGGEENDFVFGENGSDFVYGDGGYDRIFGGAGNDWGLGGDANDYVYGGEGIDRVYGGNGNDFVFGQQGIDFVYGDDGDDRIYGGDDADRMYGGEGRDFVVGDKGNDYLTGGKDADRFYFVKGDGQDVIMDFEDGSDLVQLRGIARADLSISQSGGDVLVKFIDRNDASVEDQIRFKNMDEDDIDFDDFIFT